MTALEERLAELTATLAERDRQLEERREELGATTSRSSRRTRRWRTARPAM